MPGRAQKSGADQVIRVNFPTDFDIDAYELLEEGKPYREWCIPAALINDRATVTLMADEIDSLSDHAR
jgi:hypothetical protein